MEQGKTLLVQRIFGINPLKEIHPEKDYSYWHIGRFAIDSFLGVPTLTSFKLLMLSAILLLFAMTRAI